MDDQLTPLAASGLKLPAGAGRYSGTLIGKLAHETAGADLEPAPLDVAFVNLMPDTAFLDTEEQFLGLAWDAAWQIGVPLRLWRFWIRGVPRGDEVMRRISQSYLEIETLMGSQVDALIVTGTEPRADTLEEEAFWAPLAQLIEWSADAVPSVILSCLASHAAAKLFDGVERTRLPQKLSGVYRSDPTDSAATTKGLQPTVWLPHSRSNDIPTSALESRGYRPLLSSGESWTAIELERSRARFLMFQGHPEYFPNSLLREHRRDVRRYLSGERDSYPPVPENYLNEAGISLLDRFAELPTSIARDPQGMAEFPIEAVEAHIEPSWRHTAETLYGNWLGQVVARRTRLASADPSPAAGIAVLQGAPANA